MSLKSGFPYKTSTVTSMIEVQVQLFWEKSFGEEVAHGEEIFANPLDIWNFSSFLLTNRLAFYGSFDVWFLSQLKQAAFSANK